jgi:NlpC/P60 family
MLATVRRPLPRSAALSVALLLLPLLFSLAPPLMPRADALTARQGDHVVAIAASKRGAPYRWGADGPHYFDCSGFTKWVFARIGRSLPHSAARQAARVTWRSMPGATASGTRRVRVSGCTASGSGPARCPTDEWAELHSAPG